MTNSGHDTCGLWRIRLAFIRHRIGRSAGSRFIIVEQITGDEFLNELLDVILSC